MNSKLVNHLRLAFLTLFVPLSTMPLQAMPAGNPAYPILVSSPSDSCSFDLCSSSGVLSSFFNTVKVGFFGDHIFSEAASVKNVPIILSYEKTSGTGTGQTTTAYMSWQENFEVLSSNVNTNGLFATIAFADRSRDIFPLLDLSLTGRIGGLKQFYRIPLSAFRVFSVPSETQAGGQPNTAQQSNETVTSTSQAFHGSLDVQTNFGFSWEVSLKKIIWKDGISFIGMGVDYRHAACPLNYLYAITPNQAVMDFSPSGGKLSYKEWAISIGVATYVNDYILPYLSLSTGNVKRYFPKENFASLASQLNMEFTDRKVTSFHRANLCAGITNYASDIFYYSIEARWGYQRALNLSTGMHF